MQAPLIAVIYDGTHNSVFESQVLQPLINVTQQKPQRSVWLISFESNKHIPIPPSLKAHGLLCVIYKKVPFVGRFSLRIAAYQLRKFLSHFDQYELLARGPLAGFVCLRALDANKCTQITIQARGLLAEEYAYTHRHEKNKFKRLLQFFRKKQFYKLEKYVYGDAPRMKILRTRATRTQVPLIIQAVSSALGKYLNATYATPVDCVRIAEHDIPPVVPVEQAYTSAVVNSEMQSRKQQII